MKQASRAMSFVLGSGFVLGIMVVSGCGDPEEGAAPKLKGTKDEIQKSLAPPPAVKGAAKGRKG